MKLITKIATLSFSFTAVSVLSASSVYFATDKSLEKKGDGWFSGNKEYDFNDKWALFGDGKDVWF